jgi:hypothetical protein
MSRHRIVRPASLRSVVIAVTASVAVAAVSVVGHVGSAGAAASRTFAVSPGGHGTACSSAAPCSLPTAIAAAVGGDTVRLAGGTYGDVTLPASGKGTAAAPISVVAASGAKPVFHRLYDSAPYLSWSGVTVTDVWYLYYGAKGTTLTGVLLDGAGLMVRASNVTVANSEFRNGKSIDGIQIGDKASNILIRNNWIHDYNQNGGTGFHADCIQMFDSSTITIRANRMANCYNAAVIFSPGNGTGVSNVLLESNFIQGCVVKDADCGGGTTLDLRYAKATKVTVRNNTLVDGYTRLQTKGVVFDRNIVSFLSDCSAPMTNSIVGWWDTKQCSTPSSVGRNGTRSGTVRFVAQSTGNLHVAVPADAVVKPSGSNKPAAADFDGTPFPADVAGADAPAASSGGSGGGGGGGGGADTKAPTVTLTSPKSGGTATGSFTAVATATDNVGVTRVQFFFNGKLLGNGTRAAGNTWRLTVGTAGLQKGKFPVTAKASDAAGHTTTSAGANLTVR